MRRTDRGVHSAEKSALNGCRLQVPYLKYYWRGTPLRSLDPRRAAAAAAVERAPNSSSGSEQTNRKRHSWRRFRVEKTSVPKT